MESARIRRLCRVMVLLACLLPVFPGVVGMPLVGGIHCGNAPLYGDAECMAMSFGLLLFAALGVGLTQRGLPRYRRRLTLAKAFLLALAYLVIVSAFVVAR